MLPPDPAAAHLDIIAKKFAAGFKTGPSGWRTVGREAEYPLVRGDGTAAEIGVLWATLAELSAERGLPLEHKREGRLTVALIGKRFTFFSEVGRGTMEVLTGPRDDLWQLCDDHELAMEILLEAAVVHGFRVLGYGIQPLTAPSAAVMTPKDRYSVLLEAIGTPWLWFTLTASDQVHASIVRDEVVPLANVANLLAPVTVALTANSPVYAGEHSGYCSAREGHMGEIHAAEHRHGMPAEPFRDIDDMVRRLAAQPFLIEVRQDRDGAPYHQAYGKPFTWWLGQHGDNPLATGRQDPVTAFMLHEHYIWNSARPRSNHGTLELRAACQQPWIEPGLDAPGRRGDHMTASALGVAMVCGGARLATLLEQKLGDQAWPRMRTWHSAVIADGLAAPDPVPGLLEDVLAICDTALAERGRGEEQLLAPLHHRVAIRQNPAQRALSAFGSGGIQDLVDLVAVS